MSNEGVLQSGDDDEPRPTRNRNTNSLLFTAFSFWKNFFFYGSTAFVFVAGTSLLAPVVLYFSPVGSITDALSFYGISVLSAGLYVGVMFERSRSHTTATTKDSGGQDQVPSVLGIITQLVRNLDRSTFVTAAHRIWNIDPTPHITMVLYFSPLFLAVTFSSVYLEQVYQMPFLALLLALYYPIADFTLVRNLPRWISSFRDNLPQRTSNSQDDLSRWIPSSPGWLVNYAVFNSIYLIYELCGRIEDATQISLPKEYLETYAMYEPREVIETFVDSGGQKIETNETTDVAD